MTLKVHHLANSFSAEKPVVLTIGTYDGVHAGHRAVLNVLAEKADEINGETALLTFNPHPRVVLYPENHGLKLINTLEERRNLLNNAGLDHLIIADFNLDLARQTPLEYVRGLLAEGIKPTEIVIGDDHRFGKNREGDFETLMGMGTMFGFGVTALDSECVSDVRVSSTKIRNAIYEGNVAFAKELLTHYFPMTGRVVKGAQLGRTLGFPTANLKIEDPLKIIPARGVYAVWAKIEEQESEWMPAMLNIGHRPTVSNSLSETVTTELHLINYDGDCYGENIIVRFVDRLRDEIEFSNKEKLVEALKNDKTSTLSRLEKENVPVL